MAPNFKTLLKDHMSLPQPSPVWVISTTIHQYGKEHTDSSSEHLEQTYSVKDTYKALETISAGFLVQATWLTSDNQLPDFIPIPMTLTCKCSHTLLDRVSLTLIKASYQEALHQSYTYEEAMKAGLIQT